MADTSVDDILAMPEHLFKKLLQGLQIEQMVGLLKSIQDEMSAEQAHFNALKSELSEQEGSTEQGQILTAAMVDSQNRLAQLMDKTTICFAQQSKRPEITNVSHVKTSKQVSTAQPTSNSKPQHKTSQQNGVVGKPIGDSKITKNNKGSYPPNSGDVYNSHSSNGSNTNNNVTKPSYLSHTVVSLSSNHVNSKGDRESSHSNKVSFKPTNRKQEETVTQQSVYTTRGVNNSNDESSVNNGSSQSTNNEEEDNTISVSQARNLFEPGAKSSSNTAVRRNFSIGAKDTVNHPGNEKPSWKPTEAARPYRSASMHNLNKNVDSNMSVKEVPASSNMKKSNTTMTFKSNNSQSSAKPMGRAPVVRTAWSQQPKPTAAAPAVKTMKTAPAAAPKVVQNPPLASKAKISLTTKSTPHLAGSGAPVVVKNSSSSRERNNSARDQSSSLHPLFQTMPIQTDKSGENEGDGHTFQMPKLKPVERGAKAEAGNIARRHSTGKADTYTPVFNHANRELPDDRVPLTFTDPMTKDSEGFHAEDDVQKRVTLKNWDPTPLLEDLYRVDLKADHSEDDLSYTNIEGYMEKLPMNKKKATLLKTWRKRYFKAKDGNLYYYEGGKPKRGPEDLDKATGCLPLCGGHLEDLGEKMLGLDDGRGRYLVVRCANEKDFNNWKTALESQVLSSMTSRWVKPLLSSPPHPSKNVVVIDMGSCSVRAGILGETPSLPQLFFPTIIGVNTETGEQYVGYECTKPEVREKTSKFIFPVRPSIKVDKFSMNIEVMPAIFRYVFKTLDIDPKDFWVMFSTPANFSDKIKEQFMEILIRQFSVKGVNIVHQTLLALYSYSAMSGVVVDIGERLEILPVTDGYIVEQGVSRQPFGGHRIAEALNSSFTEKRYRFFTDVEFQIVRMAMEKLCYISEDFSAELKQCNEKPDKFKKALNLEKYHLPKGSWTQVSNDVGWFKGPEGLFNLEVWGMDNPPLQKLIQNAILASPMDTRREMWRSIYLSGGVTLLPGFVSRLEAELKKLAPPSVTVEIHASPQRYHSSYIGACALAGMGVFEQSCISAEEWTKNGPPVLRKWHMY